MSTFEQNLTAPQAQRIVDALRAAMGGRLSEQQFEDLLAEAALALISSRPDFDPPVEVIDFIGRFSIRIGVPAEASDADVGRHIAAYFKSNPVPKALRTAFLQAARAEAASTPENAAQQAALAFIGRPSKPDNASSAPDVIPSRFAQFLLADEKKPVR